MFVSEKSRLEAGEMSNGKGNSIGRSIREKCYRGKEFFLRIFFSPKVEKLRANGMSNPK